MLRNCNKKSLTIHVVWKGTAMKIKRSTWEKKNCKYLRVECILIKGSGNRG